MERHDPFPGCYTCTLVVKGQRGSWSLPLFDSQDDTADLELLNFFCPLGALPVSPALPLKLTSAAETSASERRRSPLGNFSSRESMGSKSYQV